jgi:hypothetical protein
LEQHGSNILNGFSFKESDDELEEIHYETETPNIPNIKQHDEYIILKDKIIRLEKEIEERNERDLQLKIAYNNLKYKSNKSNKENRDYKILKVLDGWNNKKLDSKEYIQNIRAVFKRVNLKESIQSKQDKITSWSHDVHNLSQGEKKPYKTNIEYEYINSTKLYEYL